MYRIRAARKTASQALRSSSLVMSYGRHPRPMRITDRKAAGFFVSTKPVSLCPMVPAAAVRVTGHCLCLLSAIAARPRVERPRSVKVHMGSRCAERVMLSSVGWGLPLAQGYVGMYKFTHLPPVCFIFYTQFSACPQPVVYFRVLRQVLLYCRHCNIAVVVVNTEEPTACGHAPSCVKIDKA